MIIKVTQLNCQKREATTRLVLQQTQSDILLLQEPYCRPGVLDDPNWVPIYHNNNSNNSNDSNNNNTIRAVTYVRADSESKTLIMARTTTRDAVLIDINGITLANVYNQESDLGPKEVAALIDIRKYLPTEEEDKEIIIAGDYNLHHPNWNKKKKKGDRKAEEMVKWLDERGMVLCSEPDVPTHDRGNVLDLIFATPKTAARIQVEGLTSTLSDHKLIEWTIRTDLVLDKMTFVNQRYNISRVDPERFDKSLTEKVKQHHNSVKEPKNDAEIDELALAMETILRETMEDSLQKTVIGPFTKRWWNRELKDALEEALDAKRKALRTREAADIQAAAESRRDFQNKMKQARNEEWNKEMESARGGEIWTIYKRVKPREKKKIMPPLKKPDGSLTETLEEKRNTLWKALLPEVTQPPEKEIVIQPNSQWPALTTKEIETVMTNIPKKKAPGEDGIPGEILRLAWKNKEFQKRFAILLNACIAYGHHPEPWRDSLIVVLPKPGKKDYTEPRAYRPIALIKTMSKVLEKIVQRRLAYLTEKTLPKEQYGGRPGYCATDAVCQLVYEVENKPRTKRISAIMIDIQGAFDHVDRNVLLETMEEMNLPNAVLRWTSKFMSGRRASLLVDRLKGPMTEVRTGIPQGSPISPLLFLIYTTPLYRVIKEAGGTPLGFIDDITISVEGDLQTNSKKLSTILQKCWDWTKTRRTSIDLGPKLGFIHFGRIMTDEKGREIKPKLTLPNGETRDPMNSVKLLGIILDKQLNFHEHMAKAMTKATNALGVVKRLGGLERGITGSAARSVYIACVRPIMEYGVEVWHHKLGQETTNAMDKIQNQGLRYILGAYSSTTISTLQKEAAMPPMKIRLEHAKLKKTIRMKYSLHLYNGVAANLAFGKLKSFLRTDLASLEDIVGPEFRQSGTLEMLAPPWESQTGSTASQRTEQQSQLENRARKAKAIEILERYTATEWNTTSISDFQRHSWYNDISRETPACIKTQQLVTVDIMRRESRSIMSRITQLRTGHGDLGRYYQRFPHFGKDFTCKCGNRDTIETRDHFLLECPRQARSRHLLKEGSNDLNLKQLLNSRKGLQATAAFLRHLATTPRD